MKSQVYFLFFGLFLLIWACSEKHSTDLAISPQPQIELPSSDVREANGIKHVDGVLRFSEEFNSLQFEPESHSFNDLDAYYKEHLSTNGLSAETMTRADKMAISNMRGVFLNLAGTAYNFPASLTLDQLKYYAEEMANWEVLLNPDIYQNVLEQVKSLQLFSDEQIAMLAQRAQVNNNSFYASNTDVSEKLLRTSGWSEGYYEKWVQNSTTK